MLLCYYVTMLLCYVGLSVMFSMFNLHLPMKKKLTFIVSMSVNSTLQCFALFSSYYLH